jgi:hypothetical protein
MSVVEDEIYDLTVQATGIARKELPATEKLHQIMHNHLEHLLANKDFYTKMTYEVQRLNMDCQRRIQAKRHAYQDLLRGLVEDAIREGSFRPINPLLAARTILSLLSPAVFTSRPTGTPEQMMDEAIEIFYRGVQA